MKPMAMALPILFASPCACSLSDTVLAGDAQGDTVVVTDPRADESYEDVGECTEPMPDGCSAFSSQIWPVATDGGATCTDSRGNDGFYVEVFAEPAP